MDLGNFRLEDIPERISKNHLKHILKCSAPTIYRYCVLAQFIPDFESDYPSVTIDSPAITSVPLTRYQAWVVYVLMVMAQELTYSELAKCIKNRSNPTFLNRLSKNYFLQITKIEYDAENKQLSFY
jgi:hypothetical protein